MIHRSPFPEVEIPDVTIGDLVLRHADRLAEKAALVDGPTGRALTYGELSRSVGALAAGLGRWGLAPGQVAAVMAPNIPEYAVAFHGVLRAGAVATTINPTYTDREVHHQLVDADAVLLFTVSGSLATARAAAEGTSVREIVLLDAEPSAAEGATALSDLFADESGTPVAVDPGALAVLPYSSGTTGLSKGVMLTHRNLVSNVVQTVAVAGLDEDDVLDAVLPFFHIYGMQVMMNCGLSVGATVVTLPRFDMERFLAMHSEHGVTRSFLAPPVVLALTRHPAVAEADLSSLKLVMSAAAPLSAELAAEASERLGVEVVQGYGMTELSPVTHLTPMGGFKPGSVGPTVPNTETRITDPSTGEVLGIGLDGEVCVRGPQVMAGYLGNPTATAATIDEEGWLHTGDLGHVDADGHLFIVDRLKELIKVKGFQVPPAELEALLLTHPAVADAAVVGAPDDEAGEVPVGFVVARTGQDQPVDPAEIMSFVNDQVAGYKRLARVEIVDAIPKSASGKILRRELRAATASPPKGP